MKKIINNIKTLAALLIASATFVACSSDDNIIDQQPAQPAGQQVYTMTVNALKGGDAPTTRALSPDGSTLNATWTEGDEVKVYNSSSTEIGTLTAQTAGANTTLNGTLTTLPSNSETLTLKYLSPNYSSQDGTLTGSNTSIDKVCDYATAEVTVSSISGSNITTTDASFQNQQAIVKFTLVDKADGTTSLSATELTVNDGTNTYTVTPASATSVIYVAIPGIASQAVTLTATVGSDTYTYEKSGVSFTNGKYYEITAKMKMIPEGAISGKFTINGSGTQVYFSKGNLQATYNGSSWTWAFAANQWGYIGNAEGNTKVTDSSPFVSGYSGSSTTVDLFGWVGTSSTWTDVAQYGITSSTARNNTNGYGNNVSEDLKSDWGNTIGSGWRTLTSDEWTYVFNTRTSGSTVNGTSNARYTHATINTDGTGVNGMILFPDGITVASSEATSWGSVNAISEYATKCTSAQWTALAAKGCVFLPAAGCRFQAEVDRAGSYGHYWSSSPSTSSVSHAYYVRFRSGGLYPAYSAYRYNGFSVRLVRDAQ